MTGLVSQPEGLVGCILVLARTGCMPPGVGKPMVVGQSLHLAIPMALSPDDSSYLLTVAPIFPVEVLENIVDMTWEDAELLCSFALTCRDLHTRSRHHLFSWHLCLQVSIVLQMRSYS